MLRAASPRRSAADALAPQRSLKGRHGPRGAQEHHAVVPWLARRAAALRLLHSAKVREGSGRNAEAKEAKRGVAPQRPRQQTALRGCMGSLGATA